MNGGAVKEARSPLKDAIDYGEDEMLICYSSLRQEYKADSCEALEKYLEESRPAIASRRGRRARCGSGRHLEV